MSYRNTLSRSSLVIMALAAAAGLAACDSDTDNGVEPPVASAIKADSAHNNQTGTVGLVLADSIQVHVTTSSGTAVSGVTVTWAVATGGGTVAPTTSVTNATGDARSSLILGATAGANTVTASIPGGASATITATGAAAP
jgi:hypothetical protein